jgi:hypothetical protein
MSVFQYAFDPPPGEKRSESWINDLLRFFGPERAREILEATDVEIARRRRAMLAEGKARDPDFVLSKAEYDAAAEGNWTIRVDGAGQFTVEHERPRPKLTVISRGEAP